MSRTVYVAFLWHMHQPVYIDPYDGEILLPFVRLHAIKDYYEMIMISNSYDELSINYNFVPSLIDQLGIYSEKKYDTNEKWLQLTIKDPIDLSQSEKLFIINNFFHGNPDQMIASIPSYLKLYHKAIRTTRLSREPSIISKSFDSQELRDIQVLHLLSWFGEYAKKNNPAIAELIKKENSYSEDDKKFVLDQQFSMIDSIVDTYRQAFKTGRIEISTTPYYHPILPLIIDSDIAGISSPKPLPPNAFRYPEDARYQIEKAKKMMSELFERPIEGIWPSEGSLSNDTLELFTELSVKWVATDEGNLYKSKYSEENKYFTPYKYTSPQNQNRSLDIFFRNHTISDRIGFVYSRWNSSLASDDLIGNIKKFSSLSADNNPLIPIILDGENCWEYYNNNGYPFLCETYEKLLSEDNIKTITFSQYLENFSNDKYRIFSLNPGSWINDNFDIWIGNSEENTAWSLLKDAREKISPDKKGYGNILIAEGSDWFWWYGDQHFSAYSKIFDRLFRRNLQISYEKSGIKYPDILKRTLKKKTAYRLYEMPKVYLNPSIDGRITNFYEWLNAGQINVSEDFGLGSLHQRNIMINKLLYGFNRNRAFLMLVFSDDFIQEISNITLKLAIEDSKAYKFSFRRKKAFLESQPVEELEFAFEDIFEIGLPIKLNQQYITFRLIIEEISTGATLESYPIEGFYKIKIPLFKDYADFWYV